jgi:hypothetical protein
MQTSNQASNRYWRGIALAAVIWSFWAALPSALLKRADTQAFAAAQIGTASLSYLENAPRALCWYLVLGQCVMLPTLIALAWWLPKRPERLVSAAQAGRHWSATLLPYLGVWAALYLGGEALMAALDLRRGAEAPVVRGYAFYLGLYGFLATLPQCGWVFACRTLIQRSWLSALASVACSAVVAVCGLVLQARHYSFPSPTFLRNELFSGHPDAVAHAQWGFASWFALLTLAVACVLIVPTLSRRTVASLKSA